VSARPRPSRGSANPGGGPAVSLRKAEPKRSGTAAQRGHGGGSD
jgi:hypothetical protein